ncbi:MAG: glycosyltransferase [Bacteroidetes bacterium]|nr:glycosyltransferase [Bacteroidota bacterium]MBS1650126.1 glycosyltransferase [Bacteroidota bacterium]
MSKLRLGIISDCIHFQHPNGKFGTETHILLHQIEALAFYFSEVILCCPVVAFDDKKVATFYSANNIKIIAVPNVGGNAITDKLKLFSTIPKWCKAFKKVNNQTDIVYQRFPNNLNIPGFFYFKLKGKKTFATYTGTWKPYKSEPITYSFQRWLLKHFFRGPVWAYTDEIISNSRIHAGFSPSYTKNVWNEETLQVEQRIKKLETEKLSVLKLITVGALVANKNQQLILNACLQLKKNNIDFTLTIVGDGILKKQYQNFIQQYQLQQQIFLVGKKTSQELRELYRANDFVVQAPINEGFGKVPIEGFFHGLIPILSNLTMATVMTENGKRGFTFNANSEEDLVMVLTSIFTQQNNLSNIIGEGRNYAISQTLEGWAADYYNTVITYYGL